MKATRPTEERKPCKPLPRPAGIPAESSVGVSVNGRVVAVVHGPAKTLVGAALEAMGRRIEEAGVGE